MKHIGGIMNNSSQYPNLANFFSSRRFRIPEYQREYAWTQSETEDLWLDLMDVIKYDKERHFFGQIVLFYENSKIYIIDGQQRVSTSIILISVICRFLKAIGEKITDEEEKMEVQEEFYRICVLYLKEKRNDPKTVKLIMNKIDQDYFLKTIIESNPQFLPSSVSHKRIKEASDYFCDRLEEYLEEEGNEYKRFKKIEELFNKFTENFYVTTIDTADENEAFVIFETLNARGRELETSDLLKNHLFRLSTSEDSTVKDNWRIMIETLPKGQATRYVRHYWNSQKDFVREKQLYRSIKKEIKSRKDAEEFATDLLKISKLYSAISDPEMESIFKEKKLNNCLKNIKLLGAASFYPVIIALYKENYEEKDILIIMQEVEKLIFRNFTIAGKTANKYEIFFSDLARDITKGTFDSVEEIVKAIKEEIVNNEEFKASFTKCTINKKEHIRYIYYNINKYLDNEYEINRDNEEVHIEHIMPVIKNKWSHISDEDHKQNLWRIGNLTLLGSEYNREASNDTFENKKKVYLKTKIRITKDLLDYEEWNISKIEERQKDLAQIATKVWEI